MNYYGSFDNQNIMYKMYINDKETDGDAFIQKCKSESESESQMGIIIHKFNTEITLERCNDF